MERATLRIPSGALPNLRAPNRSIVDGTPDPKLIVARCTGGSAFRRAFRVPIYVDETSAMRISRSCTFNAVSRWLRRLHVVVALAVVGASIAWLILGTVSVLIIWIFLPGLVALLASQISNWLTHRSLIAQHPRVSRSDVVLADIHGEVASEILALNPQIPIVQSM